MTAKARKLIRRTTNAIRTAARITIEMAYAIVDGHQLNSLVRSGTLIRTNDMLDRLGIELPDGKASWYGRHVAKAYRAAHDNQDAPKAWVRHRTTGRWIHVFVYSPTDPALIEGLRTYKATVGLISQASFTEAA